KPKKNAQASDVAITEGACGDPTDPGSVADYEAVACPASCVQGGSMSTPKSIKVEDVIGADATNYCLRSGQAVAWTSADSSIQSFSIKRMSSLKNPSSPKPAHPFQEKLPIASSGAPGHLKTVRVHIRNSGVPDGTT